MSEIVIPLHCARWVAHTGFVIGLFVSLALLGLAAIDPIGIAAMPVLLLGKHPLKRSFIFLGGSFVSLMVMGLLFAQGLGRIVLRFDKSSPWLVPSAEIIAGIVLLGIAGVLLRRIKTGKITADPPASIVKRLLLGNWQLFITGALLVAAQSLVDVVFLVAMTRIGQLHLRFTTLAAAVATYAIAALMIQLAVVLAFELTPPVRRVKTLDRVHHLLAKYANRALVGVSFLLGCVLLILAA